jgi:hypothetical protein
MSGCWGHRNSILADGTNPSLSVGLANGTTGSAESFGELSDLTFTWAQELAAGYPQGLPTSFTLAPISLAGVKETTNRGGGSITLTGPSLDTASAFYFANIKASWTPDCGDSTTDSCAIPVPKGLHKNTTYYLYAQNAAGLSAANHAVAYTTAP